MAVTNPRETSSKSTPYAKKQSSPRKEVQRCGILHSHPFSSMAQRTTSALDNQNYAEHIKFAGSHQGEESRGQQQQQRELAELVDFLQRRDSAQ